MNTGKTADRRVNETEIEKLYAFTGQHYVAYYDVQTELVDHLANAIEAQWAINPAISFTVYVLSNIIQIVLFTQK